MAVGLISAGTNLCAQEALNNALALEAAQAQFTNQPAASLPAARHLGPVQLTVGAYTGVEVIDNINLSQFGRQSDTILHGGLDLGFVWPVTERSELDFNSTVGYAKYLAYPANDRLEVAPGSVLTWKISGEDRSLTFFDQFSDSQSVITAASLSGISDLPRIDNTIGMRAEWDPGRWLYQLGYSHDNFFSDAAADQYLNRASEDFFARGGRRLAADTQLGLEASVSLTKYDLPIQSNNKSYSLGPYLDWQITHFINLSVRGGYTIYAFDANGANQTANNLNSYYGNLALTEQLTAFVSQQLTVERDISLGLLQGNNYSQQLTVDYSLTWAATDHLGFNLHLTGEDGTQPLTELVRGTFDGFPVVIPQAVTENYNRVGVSPGITYQFTQRLGGSLSYSHWERASNISGNSYQVNIAYLQINYSF